MQTVCTDFHCHLCDGIDYHQCTECGEEIGNCRQTRSTLCYDCEFAFDI